MYSFPFVSMLCDTPPLKLIQAIQLSRVSTFLSFTGIKLRGCSHPLFWFIVHQRTIIFFADSKKTTGMPQNNKRRYKQLPIILMNIVNNFRNAFFFIYYFAAGGWFVIWSVCLLMIILHFSLDFLFFSALIMISLRWENDCQSRVKKNAMMEQSDMHWVNGRTSTRLVASYGLVYRCLVCTF